MTVLNYQRVLAWFHAYGDRAEHRLGHEDEDEDFDPETGKFKQKVREAGRFMRLLCILQQSTTTVVRLVLAGTLPQPWNAIRSAPDHHLATQRFGSRIHSPGCTRVHVSPSQELNSTTDESLDAVLASEEKAKARARKRLPRMAYWRAVALTREALAKERRADAEREAVAAAAAAHYGATGAARSTQQRSHLQAPFACCKL